MIPLLVSVGSALLGFLQQQQNIDMSTRAQIESANIHTREADRQSEFFRYQAQDAIDRGEADRLRAMRGFAREQGARAARLGASGMDMNTGSPLSVLADAEAAAALDASAIRQNAERESFRYREAARNAQVAAALRRNQAQYAQAAGEWQKRNVLLGTAGSMASGWFGNK